MSEGGMEREAVGEHLASGWRRQPVLLEEGQKRGNQNDFFVPARKGRKGGKRKCACCWEEGRVMGWPVDAVAE